MSSDRSPNQALRLEALREGARKTGVALSLRPKPVLASESAAVEIVIRKLPKEHRVHFLEALNEQFDAGLQVGLYLALAVDKNPSTLPRKRGRPRRWSEKDVREMLVWKARLGTWGQVSRKFYGDAKHAQDCRLAVDYYLRISSEVVGNADPASAARDERK